jgi:hypothetical protein
MLRCIWSPLTASAEKVGAAIAKTLQSAQNAGGGQKVGAVPRRT